MPAEGIHLTALREAAARASLSEGARRTLARWEDAARLGAVLPDIAYFDRYLEEVVRYAVGAKPRDSALGAVLHDHAAVTITHVLVDVARETQSAEVASLALGAASHASINRPLHPLVNALARHHKGQMSHDASHREVEKFQSICFHEEYFGGDRMGTAGIVRLVQVPMTDLFARPAIRAALARAFSAGVGEGAPSIDLLSRMGRGYEHHQRLIGSRVGRSIANEREKAAARPKFSGGAWGRFDELLERAIERSVPVLEAVWRVFEATSDDVEAARAALRALLPPGSIDDLGHHVDLNRPFVVS